MIAARYTVAFVADGGRGFGLVWIKERSPRDALLGVLRLLSKWGAWKEVEENAKVVRIKKDDSETIEEWAWSDAKKLLEDSLQ